MMMKIHMQEACITGMLQDLTIWNRFLAEFAVDCEVSTSAITQETSEHSHSIDEIMMISMVYRVMMEFTLLKK